MEKSSKRAIRRSHYFRLKKSRSHHFGYGHEGDGFWGAMPEKIKASVANTPTPCSCKGCGNPRRKWKKAKTRKEVLAFFDYIDQCFEENVRPQFKRIQTMNSWW